MERVFYHPEEHKLEIVGGGFYEGEKVTVAIDGKMFTRRVYWDGSAGDLYIIINTYKYFKSDF